MRVSSLFVLCAALGCATPKPYVSVLGVAGEHRTLVMMVEIHNPTSTPIRLSGLEYSYSVERDSENDKSRGHVTLRRTVPAGRTSVVDIPVPIGAAIAAAGAHYQLEGQLHGWAGDTEVRFRVSANGELATTGATVRTTALALVAQ